MRRIADGEKKEVRGAENKGLGIEVDEEETTMVSTELDTENSKEREAENSKKVRTENIERCKERRERRVMSTLFPRSLMLRSWTLDQRERC